MPSIVKATSGNPRRVKPQLRFKYPLDITLLFFINQSIGLLRDHSVIDKAELYGGNEELRDLRI
jgi:hypothetical protein